MTTQRKSHYCSLHSCSLKYANHDDFHHDQCRVDHQQPHEDQDNIRLNHCDQQQHSHEHVDPELGISSGGTSEQEKPELTQIQTMAASLTTKISKEIDQATKNLSSQQDKNTPENESLWSEFTSIIVEDDLTSSSASMETVDNFGFRFPLEKESHEEINDGNDSDSLDSSYENFLPNGRFVDYLPFSIAKNDDRQEHNFKSNRKNNLSMEIDVDKYMADREMTPLQERINAISVLPGCIYCLYFILSGVWISESLLNEVRTEQGLIAEGSNFFCIDGGWIFPNLHALPPLPVLAVALGVTLHAPFSFLYHWKYSHSLPAGLARTTHWSRRMDQAMIHMISLCCSFATSGSRDYFLANMVFNLDCMYRQFQPKVNPRRNKVRIAISILAYALPILVPRGDLMLFMEITTLFIIAAWLFVLYPIGGWSHSVFHFVVALVPPLLMKAACELPTSQAAMKAAAQCVVFAEQ